MLSLCLYNRTVIALWCRCCGFYTHNCERPILCLHHDSFSAAVALEREDCSISTENKCDFVCDLKDCSDEQDCGKILNFCVFIYLLECICVPLFITLFMFSFTGWIPGYRGREFVCDFEHEGKCGWTDKSIEAGYVWQRQQRGNTLPDSGPSSDYTTGTSTGTWQTVQLTLPAGAGYIYKAFQNPVIDLVLIQTSVELNSVPFQFRSLILKMEMQFRND